MLCPAQRDKFPASLVGAGRRTDEEVGNIARGACAINIGEVLARKAVRLPMLQVESRFRSFIGPEDDHKEFEASRGTHIGSDRSESPLAGALADQDGARSKSTG